MRRRDFITEFRPRRRTDRNSQLDLSGGPQGPDRRRDVGAGLRSSPDGHHARLRLVVSRERIARGRHRDGLSDIDRGCLRRLPSVLRARSLSVYRFWRDSATRSARSRPA